MNNGKQTKKASGILRMAAAGLLATSVASANIIVDGDFADAGGFPSASTITPASNADSGWIRDSTWTRSGGEAKVQLNGGGAFSLGQIVTVSPVMSTDSTLTFDWQLDFSPTGGSEATEQMAFIYTVLGTNGGSDDLNLNSGDPDTNDDWTQLFTDTINETFTNDGTNKSASGSVDETFANAGFTYLGVVIRADTPSGDFSDYSMGTAAFLDNVTLTAPIPEPSSLLLLLVSGVTLLRRPRRRK